jgi:trk system potassium uptake protein TrkA
MELEVLETARLVGTPIRDARLPDGVIIGAMVRDGKVVFATGDTVIEKDDHVVLFAASEAVREVERLFSVRLEYF